MKVALKQHLNVFPRLHCQLSSVKSMLQLPLSQCLKTYALLILLITLTFLMLFVTSLHPTDVEIHGMEGGTKQITLPFEAPSEISGQNSKDYILTGSISSAWFSQHVVHITPDDCIESLRINGVNVDLDKLIQGNTCDWRNGFDIDLKTYLKDGTNPFEIGLRDYGGLFGLCIQHSSYDNVYFDLFWILMLEIAILLYLFLKNHLQLPKSIVLVMVLGLLLHLLYLSYTPSTVRAYDEADHLDYIRYVATNWRLPDPRSGWEYYQAPLYYITAAVIYKISCTVGLNYLMVLQVLSLVYFTVFLLFGVLLFRIVCKRKWVFLTSTALLVFWPSGIIHSIRVGNDVMYYMLCVIALYFLIQWIVGKQSKHFYLASLFVALTIATKLNGLIVIGIVGCLLIMAMVRKSRAIVRSGQLKKLGEIEFNISSLHQFMWLSLKKQQTVEYSKKTLFSISAVACALYFGLFRNVRIALQDTHFNVLVSNTSSLNSGLSVGNTLRNYLYFDLHTYLTQAFTDPWHDAGGRQYFWNYFLKTMLFGEFSFPSAIGQVVAIMLSRLLLPMMIFLLFGLFHSIKNVTPSTILLLLWLILSVLSLLYLRHTYSFSPSEDFRLIFPAIIPFIYFYITGIDFFMERKLRIIGSFGYMIAYLFILASCLFFIILLAT